MVLFSWMETPQILVLAFSIRILSPVSASILLITMVSFTVTLNCLPPVAKKEEVKYRQKALGIQLGIIHDSCNGDEMCLFQEKPH